jgi:hypothetical protein
LCIDAHLDSWLVAYWPQVAAHIIFFSKELCWMGIRLPDYMVPQPERPQSENFLPWKSQLINLYFLRVWCLCTFYSNSTYVYLSEGQGIMLSVEPIFEWHAVKIWPGLRWLLSPLVGLYEDGFLKNISWPVKWLSRKTL